MLACNYVTDNVKKIVIAAGFAAALGATALSGSALAEAAGGGNVVVTSPGTVDTDGTQGSYTPAMQGQLDSDGDQDAYSNGSWEATPQDVHPKS